MIFFRIVLCHDIFSVGACNRTPLLLLVCGHQYCKGNIKSQQLAFIIDHQVKLEPKKPSLCNCFVIGIDQASFISTWSVSQTLLVQTQLLDKMGR